MSTPTTLLDVRFGVEYKPVESRVSAVCFVAEERFEMDRITLRPEHNNLRDAINLIVNDQLCEQLGYGREQFLT